MWMLEESKMDKKSINRVSQSQTRASAIDCKKNTDSTHKPWLRNNKKLDNSGSAPKNDTYRRNVSTPRGRGQGNKRPRARGPPNIIVGGVENTGVEEHEEPELGSVFVPGSKKQNLNHLLNFMYPSRGGSELRGPPDRRPPQHRVSHQHSHDLYLRAYCQFVVKKDGNYEANLLDPDQPVKWEQIEEIVVRSTGKSECPICLGTPVAGRVGHCGHVFCWACVLHYAAVHEKQPPPCPVCTTALQVKDMKPTRMLQWESTSEEVTMRLVRRQRGSTIVEVAPPRGQPIESVVASPLPLDSLNDAPFAKMFTASKQQLCETLERERKEIENQILAEIDTTEIVYLEQALELLKLKEDKINVQIDDTKTIEVTTKIETAPIVYQNQEVNENKLDWFNVTDDGATCIAVVQESDVAMAQSNLNPEASEFNQSDLNDNQLEEFPLIEYTPRNEQIEDNHNLTDIDKENQAKYFYFYQAEDGQQVFLHKLNIRILNASWGALAAAPSIIRGRVLHRDTHSLDDQTRKRNPFTAHLPLYCSFDTVELDLQPPYVTTTALKKFADDLKLRSHERARHEREERRRERAYRRAMEGPPKPDFSSEVLFPPATPSYSSPPLSETAPPLSPSTSTASPSSSGLSFAKMASTSGTWRVRKPVTPPPPPPADEDEGSAQKLRALSLSDAIEAAIHAAPSPSPTGKKNKKSKQKVLFVTGMHRAA